VCDTTVSLNSGVGLASESLELKHAARVNGLIAALAEGKAERSLSEYAFANLWLFRREHRYRFVDGEWPVIAGHTYDGQPHAMPLFELSRAPLAVIDDLLDKHGCLYPVPAATTELLDPDRYTLSTNRDDADYLYPADNFRLYRGRRLNKKRNLMKQLLSSHEVAAEPYGSMHEADALAVLLGWMGDKAKAAGSADERPCRDALANASALGLWGFFYWVDGEPAGFILAEQLAPVVHAVRFAKSRHNFNGLAQYIFHHFSTQGPTDLGWINFEQDLGLSNFRQTKLSYQPARLLDKWRVQRRS
jgi:hypothetical protein